MRFVTSISGLSCAGLLLACSSTAATSTTITRPELVAVSPDDFLGTLHCGDGPDDVRSYVATLFDATSASDGGPTPETGFPLPSSPATSCNFPVTFSFVVPGHRYRAAIDAYDRLPKLNDGDQDPTHISAVTLGGRLQQDQTGAHIAPRWTAQCGGYPATDLDAGSDASSADTTDAGDASLPGVVSYGAVTQSVHDCQDGLTAVK